MIAALGLNGQIINVVPSQNLVYIRMGNAPGVGEVPVLFNDTIWQKLNDIMTLCAGTGVEQTLEKAADLKIYPNPTQDYAMIELAQTTFELTVYDIRGEKLAYYPNCFDKFQLVTKDLQNGLYFLQIRTNNGYLLKSKLAVYR